MYIQRRKHSRFVLVVFIVSKATIAAVSLYLQSSFFVTLVESCQYQHGMGVSCSNHDSFGPEKCRLVVVDPTTGYYRLCFLFLKGTHEGPPHYLVLSSSLQSTDRSFQVASNKPCTTSIL